MKTENETIIKLLLADDHSLVRKGIVGLLHQQANLLVVAEADNGKQALDKIAEMRPDVAILDVYMPDMNGFEAAMAIKRDFPDVKILFLSMHEEPEYIIRSIKSGGSGYLLKSGDLGELFTAIERVARGGKFFSPTVSNIMMESYNDSPGKSSDNALTVTLTPREKEVLQLVSDGLITKEIADKLNISPRTVETHRENIMTKLGAGNTAELIKFALLYRLVKF